jgi:phosphatidylglycerophosphate synthase
MFGKFREAYNKATIPLGRALAKLGLTPNILTGLTLVLAIIDCWIFANGDLLLGTIFLLLTTFVDVFDGAVARATGTATKFGAVFDHTLDRFAEAFFILGIILGGFTTYVVGGFALFSMLMASFVRGKAESVGGLEKCTVGIAERQEKLVLIVLGTLLTWAFPTFTLLTYLPWMNIPLLSYNPISILLMLTGVLSLITVVQRLMYTHKMTQKSGNTTS